MDPQASRSFVARILLLASAVMIGLAAAFWSGAVPVDPAVSGYVAFVLLVGGVADAALALRLFGEAK